MQPQPQVPHSLPESISGDITQSLIATVSNLTQSLEHINKKCLEYQELLNKQKSKKCPKGHPLRYMYVNSRQQTEELNCDQCDKLVYEQSSVFWSCQLCNYDLCRQCGGYKKTLCPFNHPLQFTDKYDPDQVEDGTVQCDICQAEGVKASWHCNCSFDICEICNKK